MCRGYLPLAPVIITNLNTSLRRRTVAENDGLEVVLFAPETGEALATVDLGVKFFHRGIPESAVARFLPADEKTALTVEGWSFRAQKVEDNVCGDSHACIARASIVGFPTWS